jgi:hypothetical protein
MFLFYFIYPVHNSHQDLPFVMGPMPRIASCGVTMKYWALNVKEGQRYALLNVLNTLWIICIVNYFSKFSFLYAIVGLIIKVVSKDCSVSH